MAITTVPAPPLRSQGKTQAQYSSEFEAFAIALPLMVTDFNAAATVAQLTTTTTSSTSVLIGTGSKTFTVPAGLGFVTPMALRIGNSSANFVNADVTSYSGNTLIVNVTSVVGAGTFSSWSISLAAVGANTAGAVAFTPAGNIAATNVQSAIQELDTEKLSNTGGTATGPITVPDQAYNATTWDANFETPTKNAVRDQFESLATVQSGQVLVASALSLATGTSLQLASLNLPAGEWDITGNVGFISASASFINIAGWIDTNSTLSNDFESAVRQVYVPSVVLNTPANGSPKLTISTRRFSITTPTFIQLYAQASFTVSTATAYGYISARKIK